MSHNLKETRKTGSGCSERPQVFACVCERERERFLAIPNNSMCARVRVCVCGRCVCSSYVYPKSLNHSNTYPIHYRAPCSSAAVLPGAQPTAAPRFFLPAPSSPSRDDHAVFRPAFFFLPSLHRLVVKNSLGLLWPTANLGQGNAHAAAAAILRRLQEFQDQVRL